MKILYNLTIDLDSKSGQPSEKQILSAISKELRHFNIDGIVLAKGHVEYSEDVYDQLRHTLSMCRFPMGSNQREKIVLEDLIKKTNAVLNMKK